MKRVIVIGAGFSGAATARALARQHVQVFLIERTGSFGPGLAYSTRHRDHLLNVRASNMSADPAAPDDFAEWLAARGEGDRLTFASRVLYGEYLKDVLKQAGVRRIKADVVSCKRSGDGWSVVTASRRRIRADAVVLATGNPPPSTPSVFSNANISLIDPWDARALSRLPQGDVLLLGAGLTMIDAALSLAGRGKRGDMIAVSRRGLVPRAHIDPPAAAGDPLPLPLPLSEALREFRAEVRRMTQRGEPWQLAVDRLRADTPALWRRLPLEAQQRFLRHLRPWWDVHRHRAAPQIAQKAETLMGDGRLRVLAGEIVSAERTRRGVRVGARWRGSQDVSTMEVAGVVNCTGANMNLQQSSHPLFRQLFADGVCRPHASGLGLDVNEAGRVLDAAGAVQHGLFAIGPITQGAFWECTAVPEIRVRAVQLAQEVLSGAQSAMAGP